MDPPPSGGVNNSGQPGNNPPSGVPCFNGPPLSGVNLPVIHPNMVNAQGVNVNISVAQRLHQAQLQQQHNMNLSIMQRMQSQRHSPYQMNNFDNKPKWAPQTQPPTLPFPQQPRNIPFQHQPRDDMMRPIFNPPNAAAFNPPPLGSNQPNPNMYNPTAIFTNPNLPSLVGTASPSRMIQKSNNLYANYLTATSGPNVPNAVYSMHHGAPHAHTGASHSSSIVPSALNAGAAGLGPLIGASVPPLNASNAPVGPAGAHGSKGYAAIIPPSISNAALANATVSLGPFHSGEKHSSLTTTPVSNTTGGGVIITSPPTPAPPPNKRSRKSNASANAGEGRNAAASPDAAPLPKASGKKEPGASGRSRGGGKARASAKSNSASASHALSGSGLHSAIPTNISNGDAVPSYGLKSNDYTVLNDASVRDISDEYLHIKSSGERLFVISEFFIHNKQYKMIPLDTINKTEEKINEDVIATSKEIVYCSGQLISHLSPYNPFHHSYAKSSNDHLKGRIDSVDLSHDDDNRKTETGHIRRAMAVKFEIKDWCVDYGDSSKEPPCLWVSMKCEREDAPVWFRLLNCAEKFERSFLTTRWKLTVCSRIVKLLLEEARLSYRVILYWLLSPPLSSQNIQAIDCVGYLRNENQIKNEEEYIRDDLGEFLPCEVPLTLELRDRLCPRRAPEWLEVLLKNVLLGISNTSSSSSTMDEHASATVQEQQAAKKMLEEYQRKVLWNDDVFPITGNEDDILDIGEFLLHQLETAKHGKLKNTSFCIELAKRLHNRNELDAQGYKGSCEIISSIKKGCVIDDILIPYRNKIVYPRQLSIAGRCCLYPYVVPIWDSVRTFDGLLGVGQINMSELERSMGVVDFQDPIQNFFHKIWAHNTSSSSSSGNFAATAHGANSSNQVQLLSVYVEFLQKQITHEVFSRNFANRKRKHMNTTQYVQSIIADREATKPPAPASTGSNAPTSKRGGPKKKAKTKNEDVVDLSNTPMSVKGAASTSMADVLSVCEKREEEADALLETVGEKAEEATDEKSPISEVKNAIEPEKSCSTEEKGGQSDEFDDLRILDEDLDVTDSEYSGDEYNGCLLNNEAQCQQYISEAMYEHVPYVTYGDASAHSGINSFMKKFVHKPTVPLILPGSDSVDRAVVGALRTYLRSAALENVTAGSDSNQATSLVANDVKTAVRTAEQQVPSTLSLIEEFNEAITQGAPSLCTILHYVSAPLPPISTTPVFLSNGAHEDDENIHPVHSSEDILKTENSLHSNFNDENSVLCKLSLIEQLPLDGALLNPCTWELMLRRLLLECTHSLRAQPVDISDTKYRSYDNFEIQHGPSGEKIWTAALWVPDENNAFSHGIWKNELMLQILNKLKIGGYASLSPNDRHTIINWIFDELSSSLLARCYLEKKIDQIIASKSRNMVLDFSTHHSVSNYNNATGAALGTNPSNVETNASAAMQTSINMAHNVSLLPTWNIVPGVRTEPIGEDRKLNRYYYFGNDAGQPRLWVELYSTFENVEKKEETLIKQYSIKQEEDDSLNKEVSDDMLMMIDSQLDVTMDSDEAQQAVKTESDDIDTTPLIKEETASLESASMLDQTESEKKQDEKEMDSNTDKSQTLEKEKSNVTDNEKIHVENEKSQSIDNDDKSHLVRGDDGGRSWLVNSSNELMQLLGDPSGHCERDPNSRVVWRVVDSLADLEKIVDSLSSYSIRESKLKKNLQMLFNEFRNKTPLIIPKSTPAIMSLRQNIYPPSLSLVSRQVISICRVLCEVDRFILSPLIFCLNPDMKNPQNGDLTTSINNFYKGNWLIRWRSRIGSIILQSIHMKDGLKSRQSMVKILIPLILDMEAAILSNAKHILIHPRWFATYDPILLNGSYRLATSCMDLYSSKKYHKAVRGGRNAWLSELNLLYQAVLNQKCTPSTSGATVNATSPSSGIHATDMSGGISSSILNGDLVSVVGVYLSYYLRWGLVGTKITDLLELSSKNDVNSLSYHSNEVIQTIPKVGSTVFYLRSGHERAMIDLAENHSSFVKQSAVNTYIPPHMGYVEECTVLRTSIHKGIVSKKLYQNKHIVPAVVDAVSRGIIHNVNESNAATTPATGATRDTSGEASSQNSANTVSNNGTKSRGTTNYNRAVHKCNAIQYSNVMKTCMPYVRMWLKVKSRKNTYYSESVDEILKDSSQRFEKHMESPKNTASVNNWMSLAGYHTQPVPRKRGRPPLERKNVEQSDSLIDGKLAGMLNDDDDISIVNNNAPTLTKSQLMIETTGYDTIPDYVAAPQTERIVEVCYLLISDNSPYIVPKDVLYNTYNKLYDTLSNHFIYHRIQKGAVPFLNNKLYVGSIKKVISNNIYDPLWNNIQVEWNTQHSLQLSSPQHLQLQQHVLSNTNNNNGANPSAAGSTSTTAVQQSTVSGNIGGGSASKESKDGNDLSHQQSNSDDLDMLLLATVTSPNTTIVTSVPSNTTGGSGTNGGSTSANNTQPPAVDYQFILSEYVNLWDIASIV